MSFIKKNIWAIGFAVVLIGAFAAMILASHHTDLPSATATTQSTVSFTFDASDHIEGPSNAKATLVEFADFQCPACGAYYPLVEQLHTEFPNDLRIVYKYFPLRQIHFQAQDAAQAAEAAGLQGKFWEMYNVLYKTQNDWANSAGLSPFDIYATQIGLDMTKFHADESSSVVKNRIERDIDYGNSLGINATPTFYLNGVKLDNPSSYNAFKALVQSAITANGGSATVTASSTTP